MSQEMEEVVKKNRAISLLKSWDFSAIFFGGFINNVGSYFTTIGIIFFALELTKDLPKEVATQEVALLTTFTLIPMLLLGPIGGAIADRIDRKKILYITDLIGGFAAFSLFFSYRIWHLYIFSIINASVRQFFYPAKQASLPKIVKREQLLSANGFIQSTQQLSRIIGPLAAGFTVAAFGLKIAFLVDGVSYLISSLMIMTISTNLKPKKNGERITMNHVFTDLKDGFKMVMTDKILRFIIIIFFFTILAIGFLDPLIVPYIDFEFGLGEKDFGMLMSFSAVSGIIAALAISAKKEMKRKILFMLGTIVVLGLMTSIIGIAPYLPGSVVWLFAGFSLVGMINVGFNVPFSTLLQKIVRNEHLGKISGIIDTVLTIASLLASVFAVILARYVSISIIFIIISGLIIVAGITGLMISKTSNYDYIANEREKSMTKALIKEEKEISKNHLDVDKLLNNFSEGVNPNPLTDTVQQD
ncbi:MAG: MFS transporter [Candidatus Heimdallarchaeum endolithica]|uniref:MFS transporter n=1 Tax=Candidatus Heimdallarchaeum endolithica TaxID=2876572 RepID=A0A9Y1FP61_9ARCH|nr:MAG: MFS transporter [Candidatus Heimdallarchaeum endolithica]